jgi:VWFA-related protein
MSKLICTLTLAASGLLAQAPAPPVLVHIYPVAFDLSGQPVNDLTSADFKISDQGKAGTILFFRGPGVVPTFASGPKEYSNRPGGALPHTIAILFDLMNESQSDRLDTWHAFSKSLPQLESGDSIYFYLLTLEGELAPIHAMGPKSAEDQTWPHDVDKALDKAMKQYSHARPAHMGQEDQVKKTYHQLEVLANQLAAFPGRRDIVWITSGIQNVYNTKLPCNGDWVDCALYVPHLAVTLAHASVAVNPLSYSSNMSPDVNRDLGNRNVTWTPAKSVNTAPTNANDVYSDRQQSGPSSAQGPDASLDMAQMARLTGGRTYFKQDIRAVLKQVAADAADDYEIAYDPSTANWDNKFHVIRITCERKGVKLQVRDRYYALADTRPAEERQKGVLVGAYQSPADAADIGLHVKVSPAEKGVHLDMHINPLDMALREDGGKFTGAVTFLLSDLGASGPLGDPSVSSFNLDLTKEQHDIVMKDGIPIAQDHAISDAVQRVRLIVMDQSTNAIGSLTFPVR